MHAIFRILLTSIIFSVSMAAVIGQSKDELERKRRQIQSEIDQLQQQQQLISKDKKAGIGQLNLIQSKLRKRYAVIDNINEEVRLIDNSIFANNREIYRLQKQLDTLRLQYARTIEYAYKNRSSYDMLNFIFTSSSFNDAVKRVAYLKSYRQYREDQVASIQRTRDELSVRIRQLSENKAQKSKTLEEQNEQKKMLEEEKREKAGFVNKLKAREKELSKELAAKRKLDRDLQAAIATVVRREIQKAADERKKADAGKRLDAANNANKPSGTAPAASTPSSRPAAPARREAVLESTPEVTRVSVGFENNRRNLPWPVDAAMVISGFGRRPIEGTTLFEENIGITIATQKGGSVKAVFEGVVKSVFDVAGSMAVTIQHGKYFTTYYNLSSATVSKGSQVSMGQVIGKAGVNDDGDGEIMFVVNNESTFVDPQGWLKSR
jgi:septal ring factor EnvC (AmiA/AmiB activator)